MMKSIKPASLLFLLVFFSSTACTKFGKNITVKGKVINPYTNEAVSNARILVWDNPQITSIYYWEIPRPKRSKEALTGSDGTFEIDALRLKRYYAYANAPDGYYNLGWYVDGTYKDSKSISRGKKMNLECHMVPKGQIQLHINNVNCQGPSDSMILELTYTLEPGKFNYHVPAFVGCYTSQGIPSDYPMGNYEIKWTVIRNGNTEVHTDALFVPAGGLEEYTINY